MFGKRSKAEETIRQQQELIDKYKRNYDKQQGYIEGLYDVIGELSRQLGSALNKDTMERLQNHPLLEENSNFFIDLNTLFSSRIKKGTNVTCYFGKDLAELRRKFQDRDFRNGNMIHLTERFSIEDLRKLLKEWMWKKPLVDGLMAIRSERGLD